MQNLATLTRWKTVAVGAAVFPLKDRLVGDVAPILWMLLGAVGSCC